MEPKSNLKTPYVMFPFKGSAYFLTHPRYWPLQLLAMLCLLVLLIGAFVGVLMWTWPHEATSWWPHLWGILKSIGFAAVATLLAFIVFMPLLLTLALDKMVRKMLMELKAFKKEEVTFLKSVYSSTVIFFRTLFWRIFWPVIGLIGALFLGPFGAFLAWVGIGHLAVIDGVDLTLALQGYDTKTRLLAYKERKGQIFCMGVSAGCLSMLLSFTILGWLIWVPGVIAGCTLWVMEWSHPLKEQAS